MIHFLLALTLMQYMQACGIFIIVTWVVLCFNFGVQCLLYGNSKRSWFVAFKDTVKMFKVMIIFFVPIGLVVDFFMFLGVFI